MYYNTAKKLTVSIFQLLLEKCCMCVSASVYRKAANKLCWTRRLITLNHISFSSAAQNKPIQLYSQKQSCLTSPNHILCYTKSFPIFCQTFGFQQSKQKYWDGTIASVGRCLLRLCQTQWAAEPVRRLQQPFLRAEIARVNNKDELSEWLLKRDGIFSQHWPHLNFHEKLLQLYYGSMFPTATCRNDGGWGD